MRIPGPGRRARPARPRAGSGNAPLDQAVREDEKMYHVELSVVTYRPPPALPGPLEPCRPGPRTIEVATS